MREEELVLNAAKPQGEWGKKMIDAMNQDHNEVTEWGLTKVEFRPNDTVLDVGCGGGNTISKLAAIVSEGTIYGVDYSELSVEESKKFNARSVEEGRVKIQWGSVSELPFPDDMFDVVTAVETYYFWPDQINDLAEIRRTLKPGGKILLIFNSIKDEDNSEEWETYERIAGFTVPTDESMKRDLLAAGYSKAEAIISDKKQMCVIGEK
ncbi:class I SAM-dependent methyltransferase [Anaerolentibacter hominis]|uniref:class I SAM-dependent methyltransferase n=1 Tax=Anaerolentibacter hominis TaxID=3079009 RepID=UPI0031B8410F